MRYDLKLNPQVVLVCWQRCDDEGEVTEMFKRDEGRGSECDVHGCNYTHLVHSGD